jgi:hypothetical protein
MMRKIEKEMMAAINSGRDWGKDNTRVTVAAGYRSYWADVHLHGNHIAEVLCRMGCDDVVKPNLDTLRRYPTRTTMSRLRALGVDVCTRKGVVLLDGQPISH